MPSPRLREDQWDRIKEVLPGQATDGGVTAKDHRLCLEAVLRSARTRRPWRDVDPAWGHGPATSTRCSRWSKNGVWQRSLAAVSTEADWEAVLLDSTVVRAPKKTARTRSGGGLSTPLRGRLTGGDVAASTQA